MLTQRELLILATLRRNSRESLTRMSRRISIPVSTIYDKIKSYELGLITKNTCLIDFSKIGFTTRATILLRIKSEDKERAREVMLKDKHVNTCYRITNGYDYLVEGIFRELKQVEDFVESLERQFVIEEKKIHYILEEVRKEDFLSNPEYIKLVGGPE